MPRAPDSLTLLERTPAPLAAGEGTGRRRLPSLRMAAALMVVVIAVPLFLLAAAAAWELYGAERARAEDGLLASARSIALLVDREFEQARQTLQTLAASDALSRDDLTAFRNEMLGAQQRLDAAAVSLIGLDGRIRATTAWPLDAPRNVSVNPVVLTSLRAAQPTISNLYTSPIFGMSVIGVTIPVTGSAASGQRYLGIGLVLQRGHLLRAIADLPRPADTVALVTDRDHAFVTGEVDDAAAMGRKPPGSLTGRMSGEAGTTQYRNDADGAWYVAAYARAPQSGYWVAVSLPEAALRSAFYGVLTKLALAGAALIGASLLAVGLVAGHIARGMHRLAAPDPPDQRHAHYVRELRDAAERIAAATAERERALAKMQSLFASSPVGVIRADAGGRVTEANDAFLRMVGASRADLERGHVRWDDLTPPEWLPRDEAAIGQLVRTGVSAPYQKEYIRPDGTRVPVLVFAAAANAAHGTGAAFVVDLSGWAVTEAALAKAHEQMRLAIKAGRIFFFDWNIRTGAVEWSDGLEAELGLAPGGFDGRIETFRSLVYPDDLPIVEASLAKSLDEGVPYEPEFRMRRADGTLRWVVVRSTVFRDANGKPLRMVGADIDITEQKRTESRLRDTKQNLRAALAELDAIYNAAPIGLGFVDRDLRYQRVNAAWSASNGLTAAQMIGQRVPDLVPGLWPALEPIYQRVLERGEAVDDVVVSGTVPKGEGRREWLGSYWPVWDAQGAIVGATVAFRDVTEARRAEQALQRTLAELEAIYDTAPIGLAVLDRDLVYRRVNRQLAAMRGITVDEMIGRHVNDVIPYFTPTLLPVLRDVLDAGTPQLNVELQADYPAGSGNHRYWNCSYLPLRDAHTDQVAAVVALVTEVTEAREAAARLSESEASFRTLADALPAFVFVTSPAGENRYINSFTAAFTGMTLEKVLDQGWVSFIHPEDQARARRLWQEALASGRPYHAEYRIRRHDGEWRWLLVQALPQHDANNCIARWIGTAVDISDLRTAEAALRAGEERLRLATEAGGVGIFDWDLRTGALLWDERLRSLWGVVPDAPLTIDAFYRGLHPEDVPRLQAILAAALDPAGTGDYQAEFRVIHGADGSERIISAHGRATFENGTAVRMVGTGVDVTTRRQAEAVLARDKAELEQRVAERTKALTEAAAELTAEMRRREEAQQALTQGQKLEALGHLTSGIAHDFNNVLAAVTGSLELIGRRTKDNPRVQSLVHNGEQAAERAATLVRQLLTFARREAPAPEAYDPAALIGSVDTLIVRAIGSGVTIAVDIPADAWPIMVDAHRLEVALLNLAVNGRDAMEGVGELTLSARNEPASGSRSDDPALPDARPAGLNQVADYVVIAMRDSGPGMPPEVLARASEAFFTTKPPGEGTGLGLSMVRAFAEQSGGALRILSPPGEGATVELWLPRAAEPVQPQAVDAAEPDEALHGGATILVVDDDDQVRLVTATTLRDRGYTVVEASSMRSALVQAGAGERIDLVITDVTMPGGDGMQLARQLRNRWPRLPVLFISGHVYREGLEQEVVLAKPFSPAVLADQVLASLGRRPGPPRTDQLLLRLKSGDLRSAYSLWQSLRQEAGPKRGLPRFAGVDLHALAGASHAYAVAVEGEADRPVFRFVHVGAALAARLGRPLEGMVALAEDDDEVVFGGMATAWSRCARTGAPHYDYARYSLGDGAEPVAFERLLLPMSNDGGEGVSHIIGLAAFYGVLGQERANAGQQT